MSCHIYIRKENWKDNPISKEEWKKAVFMIEELSVEPSKNKSFPDDIRVWLKSNKAMFLQLDPYGVVNAQNPNEELVEIMFKLSKILNAKVYSEKSVPYESIIDWKKRTRKYYEKRDGQSRKFIYKKWLSRVLFWLGVFGVLIFLKILF